MKLIKQPWFLILVFVAGVYTWQYYSDPKIVEISSNKAQATNETADIEETASEDRAGSRVIPVKVSKGFKASQIKNFELATYLPMKVKFTKSDGDQIIISLIGEGDEYKNDGQKLNDWFQISQQGGTLKVHSWSDDKQKFNGFSSLKKLAETFKGDEISNKTFIIEFPANYSFNKVKLEGVSNDIFASEVSFSEFKVARVSGNFVMAGSQGKKIKLETVSGDNKVEVKDLMAAEFATVSGDTELKSVNTNPKIKFESVSGDLALEIPKDSQVEVDFESMTGDLMNDFGVSEGETKPIKFSSLSGSARINKLK